MLATGLNRELFNWQCFSFFVCNETMSLVRWPWNVPYNAYMHVKDLNT